MRIGIGVDIGGTHICCSAIDLNTGQPLEGTHFDEKVNSKASKGEIFEAWAKPINKAIKAVDKSKLVGIGFGIPGSFNYQKGIGLYNRNDKYEHLHKVNVKSEFAPYINLEGVELRFMNDATAFGVGTAWFGKATECKRSISITLGTGFGSSFIDDIVPLADHPGVPLHGSFWQLPFKDSIADDYFSTRWFIKSYLAKTGIKEIGVREIAEKAKTDKIANELFIEFGENLAEFLIPWIHKFQPDLLVIGGNVSKAWNLIEESYQKKMDNHDLKIKTVTSDLMEEAALCGSAKLLDEDFWERVKDELPVE
ncbi:MAG: ROK family protein [Reichenbachiella sp.]